MAVAPQKCIQEQNLPTPLKFGSPHESVPRKKVFILPHESPMCSFTLPNIFIRFIYLGPVSLWLFVQRQFIIIVWLQKKVVCWIEGKIYLNFTAPTTTQGTFFSAIWTLPILK